MTSKRVLLLTTTMILALGAGYLLLGLRAPASAAPDTLTPVPAPVPQVGSAPSAGAGPSVVVLAPSRSGDHERYEGGEHGGYEHERD